MILARFDLKVTAQAVLRQVFQANLQGTYILDFLRHLTIADPHRQATMGQIELPGMSLFGERTLVLQQVAVTPPQARADRDHMLEQRRPGE